MDNATDPASGLLGFFGRLHLEAHQGVAYAAAFKRDLTLLKDLVQVYGVERLRYYLCLYFTASSTQFKGHNVPMFRYMLPTLIARGEGNLVRPFRAEEWTDGALGQDEARSYQAGDARTQVVSGPDSDQEIHRGQGLDPSVRGFDTGGVAP